jgi:Tfp pilus assembly protein PilX
MFISKRKKAMKNEKGMVLVLAIFMLALLSMIGLSSMMTSTTDINIAGNEKFSKLVYYQSESGLTLAGEMIEQKARKTAPILSDNSFFVDTVSTGTGTINNTINTITVIDGSCFKDEPREKTDNNTIWHKNDQEEDIIEDEPDIRLSGNLNAVLDIDQLGVKNAPGENVEFTFQGQGGRKIYLYHIESVAALPSNSSIKADHIMGFQFVE